MQATDDMVRAAPATHLIRSMQHQNMVWWKRLAELIDNSFDAGASHVRVSFKARKLTVSDNGRGVRDPIALIRLGDHQQHEDKGLGQYGIGLKDAWLSTGYVIEVNSVCDGIRTVMTVDSREWEANDWQIARPTTSDSDDANGTTIRISITNGAPVSVKHIWEKLEWVFAPALQSGRRITFTDNAKELCPAKLPPLDQPVVDSFDVDGKEVAIHIGILPADCSVRSAPFWLQYRHRTINDSYIGMKNRIHPRIAGTITLGDGWPLAKNKDAICGCEEELEDAIYQRIVHLLDQCEVMADQVETAAIELELEQLINSAMGTDSRREKRGRTSGQKGSAEPADTGRKRRNATETTDNPGSVDGTGTPVSKRGFKMRLDKLSDDKIGRFDRTSRTVILNVNHPVISRWKTDNNRHALLAAASVILSDYDATHEESGQKMMGFSNGEFLPPFEKLISSVVKAQEVTND